MNMAESINLAYAQRDISRQGYSLLLGQKGNSNTVAAYRLVMMTFEEGECLPEVATLSQDAAQSLMDSFWASGRRPTRDVDKSEEVAYLRNQLDRATKYAFGE